jgi:hypothetical protein
MELKAACRAAMVAGPHDLPTATALEKCNRSFIQCLSGGKMEIQTEIERYLHCRVAVIEIRPGESKADAWSLHLLEHPEDAYADIKVFNRYSRRSTIPQKKKPDNLYI